MAPTGSVGDGVLGPLEEAAEVNEDWEPACEPYVDA